MPSSSYPAHDRGTLAMISYWAVAMSARIDALALGMSRTPSRRGHCRQPWGCQAELPCKDRGRQQAAHPSRGGRNHGPRPRPGFSVADLAPPLRPAATTPPGKLPTTSGNSRQTAHYQSAPRRSPAALSMKKPCFRIAEINIQKSLSTVTRPRVRSNHELNPRRSRWLPK